MFGESPSYIFAIFYHHLSREAALIFFWYVIISSGFITLCSDKVYNNIVDTLNL